MFRQLCRCVSLPAISKCAPRPSNLPMRNFWGRPPYLPVPFSREFENRMMQLQNEFDRVFNSSFWRPFVDEHPTNVEFFRIKNPIVEENGVKKFKLEFDVRRFKPEDVKISTNAKDRSLTIEAKYADEQSKYEYQRKITIPEGVNPTDVTCTYKADGVLQLEAPYVEPAKPDPPKDTVLEIKHN
uniref:SHSP domain-containing protein n=1 Tax=Panagrolaimus sp. JU765 TaxID=591449 RepID=A0AC34Q0J0_9BILA